MLLIERKHTPLGKTYWGGEGAYSKEGNEISKRLVETSETHIPTNVHGRLMSAVNMLIYDFGNNGNGNIIEKVMRDCPECGGSGWEESRRGRNDDDDDDDDDDRRDCSCCGGDCQILDELEIREDYNDELQFVKKTLPKEEKYLAEKLEAFLTDKHIYNSNKYSDKYNYFSDENFAIYDQLIDAVVYLILTTENKDL